MKFKNIFFLLHILTLGTYAQNHVGSITNGDGGALLNGANSVFVSGNYAYVLSASNALEIVDISDPTEPFHVSN
ncbi:MAG: hypothetical protein O9262_11665, partial [Cyclobacteriaceae bacterium]|nr:hypothetical protein [Cyclobacteriaceae bacterium]